MSDKLIPHLNNEENSTRNIMDVLRERGLIKQTVYEDELYKTLGSKSTTFYVGFDPTADSLHAGHLLVLMAMSHMQKAGHRPIILLGGGTGLIGDPSGKTDMRPLANKDVIDGYIEEFKKQISRFLSFEGENAAIVVNNADWLRSLNYVDFLREIGSLFSVNRMLTADCFKSRLERGLSFMEFNYMPMQAYDFLVLFRKFGCRLQCGGDDQWSNILAGADLIRRKESEAAFAMTFPLLTTSTGIKMGKTQNGALWLNRHKTSPYEFFQYFRNVNDEDVVSCLKFLTYLQLDEINALTAHSGERINVAKERLAYEVVKIVHGDDDATQALSEARGAFSDGAEMPKATIPKEISKVADIIVALKLAPSRAEAKRLIEGGGIAINDKVVNQINAEITQVELSNGFVLHKGKKIRLLVSVEAN
ncbi:MAG: tyrosine--tRNA ligase [Christensenellaceae bacterium]|jgi:tyrosyl-tRNA synthetase|nr:tyrosine--tRNA ligase [Christensenellaceae bacterium]